MILDLFKEFMPLQQAMNSNPFTIITNAVGSMFIFFTFFILGFMCVWLSRAPKKGVTPTRANIGLTIFFGYFLMDCAIARAFEFYAIWHNYANLIGFLKITTGLLCLMAISYTPRVIKENYRERTIAEIDHNLKEVKDRLESVQEINKKLTEVRNR